MGLLEPGNCFRMDQRAESRSDEGSSKVEKVKVRKLNYVIKPIVYCYCMSNSFASVSEMTLLLGSFEILSSGRI